MSHSEFFSVKFLLQNVVNPMFFFCLQQITITGFQFYFSTSPLCNQKGKRNQIRIQICLLFIQDTRCRSIKGSSDQLYMDSGISLGRFQLKNWQAVTVCYCQTNTNSNYCKLFFTQIEFLVLMHYDLSMFHTQTGLPRPIPQNHDCF